MRAKISRSTKLPLALALTAAACAPPPAVRDSADAADGAIMPGPDVVRSTDVAALPDVAAVEAAMPVAQDAGPPPDGSLAVHGTVRASGTWCAEVTLSGAVTIAAGATVTVCPGAHVSAGAGAGLVVAGQLVTNAAENPVRIDGASWQGISVVTGGALALDGVTIENAGTAIDLGAGAQPSTVSHATVHAARVPFALARGTTLSVSASSVLGATGSSSVAGALAFDHVNYASANAEGVIAMDPAATLRFTDSRLSTGGLGADFVVIAGGAASVTLDHDELSNTHCAVHFNSSTAFEIHDSVFHDNEYAFMLGGAAGTGARRIYANNIVHSLAVGILEISANQAIDATGNFFAMSGTRDTQLQRGSGINASGTLTAAVVGAGPRP